MEKDKLPEWLKGQAQQFELTPQHGLFDVMMRKREQQRKQRYRMVWLTRAALIAIVMSISIWYANQRSEHVDTAQRATQLQKRSNSALSSTNIRKLTSSDKIKKKEHTILPETINKKIEKGNFKEHTNIDVMQAETEVLAVAPINNELVSETKILPVAETGNTVALSERVMNKDSAALPVLVDTSQSIAKKDTIYPIVTDDSTPTVYAVPPKKQSYWSIMGIFTPQLMHSIYNANSDASLSWMKKYIENREQNDKALYSFNAGIKVAKHIGPHWSLSGGVFYAKVQFEEIRIVNTIIPDSNGNEFGNLAAADKENRITQVNQNSFDISFTSLEFPLQVSYQFQRNKMHCQLSAGVAYSYLFQTRSLVFNPSDSLNVQETDDADNNRLNQHSLLLMGGVNIGYQLSKQWSLFAGPVYRYSLHSIYSKDYIIRQQPYYLGIEFGVKYSFL